MVLIKKQKEAHETATMALQGISSSLAKKMVLEIQSKKNDQSLLDSKSINDSDSSR